MTEAYQNGKGVTIKTNKRQIVNNLKVEGGFHGMLASLAAKAFLAKTVLVTLATGTLSVLEVHWLKKQQSNSE